MRRRLLDLLAALALRRSGAVLLVSFVLAAVAGALAATRLALDSNQDHLVSTELPFQRTYQDYVATFGDSEYLYLVIDGRGRDAAADAVAEAVTARLRAQPALFSGVHCGVGAELGDGLLLLASEQDLAQLSQLLEGFPPLARARTTAGLVQALADQIRAQPATAAALSSDALAQGLGVLEALADQTEAPAPARERALLDRFLPEVDPAQQLTPPGSLRIVSAIPTKDYAELDPIAGSLDAARAALRAALREHPGVEGGVTGRPAIASDEVRRTSRDTTYSALLALGGVSLLFGLFFRGVLRPLLAVLALLVGIAWTAGFATLALGRLNLLSSVFLIVLIGLGVDYAVHLLAHYQAALAGRAGTPDAGTPDAGTPDAGTPDAGTPDAGTPDAGTPDAGTPDAGTPDAGTPDAGTPDAGTPDAVPAAVSQAIHASGAGNLTAAISSAIAFYAALFTDFQGLAELGLIAGTGVLLCLLATLLVLPALLVRFDRGAAPRALPSLRWLEPVVRRPWPTLGLVLVLCGVALPAALRGLRFEEDLLSLQSREEEAVEWEMRLMERDLSSWITVERVPTLAAAAKLQADFAALDSRVVASAESAAMFLGPQVEARRARLHALAEELGPPPAAPDAALDPARLKAALGALAEALGEASEGALRAEGAPQDAVARLLALQERFEQLAAAPLDAAAQGAAQERLLTAFQARVAKLRALLTPKGWTPETLPAPIRDHFIGSDGSFGVYVSPRENVWDPVAMARFLGEVRKVAPGVTGSTVAVYESTAVLRGAFHRATLITVVAILLLLLLDFRDRAALLSLVPLGVGCLWLGGAMGALGVPFNMANFFTVPVLLGLGIDSGVHIMNHERSGSRTPVLQDMTAAAVTLSLLTTSVSFGSLAISGHKGMASIGHVMVLGALLVLAASLVVLPALNRLLAPQPAP